ncbi:putative ATP-grasp-modified RiPP [Streptosporangium sp. NPDC051022]|uniref:putative ATP-grasp-modified RiPP n=1 Tax=Streptosporangium sp. NPDC051022 TaxID=3155752 RepID=UPI0034338CCF
MTAETAAQFDEDRSEMTVAMPWGLKRATKHLTQIPQPYATTELDPVSQLTRFYDAQGTLVDMSREGTSRAYLTVTMSRPEDGSQNAPQGGDDTRNDEGSD